MGPREWVEQALVQYWGQMKKVIETGQRTAFRHGGLLRSLDTEQALRLSSEEEQVIAIESEEYEKADELNEAIEKSKAATLRIEKDLAAATKELEAQRVEREQCHKRVVAALSESVAKLDSLKKERGGALSAFVTAEKRRLEESEDEVQAEMGRVERVLQHTKSDLEDVAAAQGRIEELIKADTRDVQEEKAKLTTAKIAFEIDLDALREQLRLKEAEVEGNDRALQAAEDEINKVRVGHERKLNRLGEQEAQIATEQTGAESEQEELKGRRAGLLHETEVMEGKAAAMRAGIAGVSGDAATVATFLLRMTAEETRGNTFLVSARRCEARVEELSRQKQQTASRAESLRVALADLEARIAEHHQTIVGVDLKKPSLEAQKKAEVAKRDFKVLSHPLLFSL
jgi:chromosome segregation ATPase